MAVYDLCTSAPSKQCGLKCKIGDTFFDVNGRVYKTVKAPKKTRCIGCAFEDFKDPANEIICRHIVCAHVFRQDNRDVVFQRVR